MQNVTLKSEYNGLFFGSLLLSITCYIYYGGLINHDSIEANKKLRKEPGQ